MGLFLRYERKHYKKHFGLYLKTNFLNQNNLLAVMLYYQARNSLVLFFDEPLIFSHRKSH